MFANFVISLLYLKLSPNPHKVTNELFDKNNQLIESPLIMKAFLSFYHCNNSKQRF